MGVYFNAYSATIELSLSTFAYWSLLIMFSFVRRSSKRFNEINERNGEIAAELQSVIDDRKKIVGHLKIALEWYRQARAVDPKFDSLFTTEAFLLFEDDIRMILKREGIVP